MTTRRNLRSALLAVVLGLVVVAAGCSSSTDPESWAEAEAEPGGSKIEENFLVSCEESNTDEGDVEAYCACAYVFIREFYADDFEGFKTAESELRSDPEAINNSAVIPTAVGDALDACAAEHL